MSMTSTDIKFMKLALRLSQKAMGFTEPNPLVGAVVVDRTGTLIATGYHHAFGGPHAEREALANVPPGTTLYVTLEPCCHFGKTPPCTEFILEKKVSRVVAAMQDPNPAVNGKGFQILKQNNIDVEWGILEDMAREINRHYLTYITSQRPYVTLRAGISMDGKLTDNWRHSQWVTDIELRKISHSVRGEFSAILAGAATVRDDNPSLTLREPMMQGKKLFRVILDTDNTLGQNQELQLFKNIPDAPLVLFSAKSAIDQTIRTEHHYFVNTISQSFLDLNEVLGILRKLGIASVLVEGGGTVIDSFLQSELYDEVILFQAGTLIGGTTSVQIFASGVPVDTPIRLSNREIIPLTTGHIIRGYRCLQESY